MNLKRGPKKGTRRSPDVVCLEMLKEGKSFYSLKADKDLTAIANKANVKISTQRLIVLHPATLETQRITKVTILKP